MFLTEFSGAHPYNMTSDRFIEEFFLALSFWLSKGKRDLGSRRPQDNQDVIFVEDVVSGDNAVASANNKSQEVSERCWQVAEYVRKARQGHVKVQNLYDLYEQSCEYAQKNRLFTF